jgi:steroid delta-isomerase-like uncharacterized protein
MAGTGTHLVQAATDWVEGFNEADWERWGRHLAPDIVYAETGTGRRIEGLEPYLDLCRGWRAALPDVKGTIRNVLASGDTVAQGVLWQGTHTGPMQTPGGTLEASGQRVSVEASLWARFEGDKIQEVHHYLDVLTLLQQVGAMPAQAAG